MSAAFWILLVISIILFVLLAATVDNGMVLVKLVEAETQAHKATLDSLAVHREWIRRHLDLPKDEHFAIGLIDETEPHLKLVEDPDA